jgi:ribosomal protein S6--L-glutamate ligase
MNLVVLSTNAKLYSTARLVEEGQKRGHRVDVVHTLKCYMDITSKRPMVLYKDRELADIDAVIPRIGASITFYGLAILRQFEMMGVYALNESVAIGRSRDKLRSLQILSRKGLGLPRTSFAHSIQMTSSLIELVGGAPLVVKLLEGSQGKGVVLAETLQGAESVIDAFKQLDADILVQEYVKEADGADIRCFVMGGKVIATMMRKAKAGEFRSNLHRGGSASLVKITPEERDTAIKSAKVLGLNVAGVDLLRSKSGPKVMEVNSSPGLEGIEKVTGHNIAGMIIEFIEKNAKKGKVKTKGKG